jgi:hypothetical protein
MLAGSPLPLPRAPGAFVVVPATAENLGMINAATHLLKVEEAQS